MFSKVAVLFCIPKQQQMNIQLLHILVNTSSFFPLQMASCPSTICWRLSWTSLTFLQKLIYHISVGLFLDPLFHWYVYPYGIMLINNCFIASRKIRSIWVSSFVLQNCFGYAGSFAFPYKFLNYLELY